MIEGIESNINHIDFYLEATAILSKNKMHDRVMEIYGKGTRNNPKSIRLFSAVTQYLLDHNRSGGMQHSEVGRIFETDIQKDIYELKDTDLLQSLAYSYYQTKNYAQAIETYNHTAELLEANTKMDESNRDKNLSYTYFFTGQSLSATENYSEALLKFEKTIEANSQFREAYLGISTVYRNLHQREKSIAYEKMAERYPSAFQSPSR